MSIFQLSNGDKNRFVNVLKLFFGVACIAVAVYLAVYGINYSENGGSTFITVLFLSGFGFYEIWSGLGKAERYIEIDKTFIKLKKYVFLPVKYIETSELVKIEAFPLKINFHIKERRKIILRFGINYIETNEKIVDCLVKFAKQNAINFEIQTEDITAK